MATPNTQPIFIQTPLMWVKALTNQAVPAQPTAALPMTFGTAGENGSLIESITIIPVASGTGTVHIYGKGVDDTDYKLLVLPIVVSASRVEVDLYPVLSPVKQSGIGTAEKLTGLRLPALFEVAIAVNVAVVTGAIHVMAMGGDY